MDADGNPLYPGDLAAQLELSLDNLEAVLAVADMTLANVRPAQLLRQGRRRVVQAIFKS